MQPKRMPWFRAYASEVDDPNIRLLAFEDRWHFHALKCLKSQGVLDAGDHPEMLRRKVAVKLGLQLRELEAAADRIAEVGLIDPETFQPLDWVHQQFRSDTDPTATKRKQKWRDKKREENQRLAEVTDVSRVTGAGQPTVTSVTSQNVTRTETTTTKANTRTKTTTTDPEALIWEAASWLSEADRVVVVEMLEEQGLAKGLHQSAIDELGRAKHEGVIRKAWRGWFRSVIQNFRPNYALSVQAERAARDAKANSDSDARRPGQGSETPFENAIGFARQAPDKAEFERRMADAVARWPEEASNLPRKLRPAGERRAR